MTRTFHVRGVKIRTASNRRFVYVRVYRKNAYKHASGDNLGYTIVKRSDDIAKLRREIVRYGFAAGTTHHILDQKTGEVLL